MRDTKVIAMGKLFAFMLIAVLLASSCTEKIDLKLKSSGAHTVIEGNITDQPGPYTVRVYNSLAYYEGNNFPGISGATVVVKDDASHTDTLHETKSGYYQTSTLQGVSGRTYYLNITANGAQYSAVSTMPNPATIDTLATQTFSIFGQNRIALFCFFPDPANETNYYRITTYQDSITAVEDRAYSDEFSNGSEQNSIVSTKNALQHGDTVQVILQAIDKPVYTYFTSLRANTSSQSAAPANPISNISNSALGYFSACTVRSKTVVIP